MKIVHLVGSPSSTFLFELSLLYAREPWSPPGAEVMFAVAHPCGKWGLGSTVDVEASLGLPELLGRVMGADLVVPHMFCEAGMTTVRGLFEDCLGLPIVGSRGQVMALALDKIASRGIAAAAGVQVAQAEVCYASRSPRMEPPYIVKAPREDNSLGLSIVRDARDGQAAVEEVLRYGSAALVEAFIEGREVRVAVLDLGGELVLLPVIEYLLEGSCGVRMPEDKLQIDEHGVPLDQASGDIPSVCPATLEHDLRARLEADAFKLFCAFDARDYALFDFRITPAGEVVFLEAGFFWSFGEKSMVSRMLRESELDWAEVTARIWEQARARVE